MTRQEYHRLRAAIEDTYRRDLEALDRIWQLDGEKGDPVASTTHRKFILAKGRVEMLVRWAVADLGQQFTVREVMDQLRRKRTDEARHMTRASVSSAMRRLAEQDFLEVVKPGMGQTPSVYRVKRDEEPEDEAPY